MISGTINIDPGFVLFVSPQSSLLSSIRKAAAISTCDRLTRLNERFARDSTSFSSSSSSLSSSLPVSAASRAELVELAVREEEEATWVDALDVVVEVDVRDEVEVEVEVVGAAVRVLEVAVEVFEREEKAEEEVEGEEVGEATRSSSGCAQTVSSPLRIHQYTHPEH